MGTHIQDHGTFNKSVLNSVKTVYHIKYVISNMKRCTSVLKIFTKVCKHQ